MWCKANKLYKLWLKIIVFKNNQSVFWINLVNNVEKSNNFHYTRVNIVWLCNVLQGGKWNVPKIFDKLRGLMFDEYDGDEEYYEEEDYDEEEMEQT